MKRAALVLVASGCLAGPSRPPASGVARQWRQRTDIRSAPGEVDSPQLIYDSKRSRVLIYVGDNDSMWQLGASEWDPVCSSCTDGMGVTTPALGYDEAGDRIVMFGGQIDSGDRVQDVWILEGDASSFTKVATTNPPPPRAGGQFVFDPSRGALIMIGGYDNFSFDDAYELDDKAWTQLPTLATPGDNEPGGVAGGSPLVAYDSDRERILALADFNTDLYQAQVWTYDPTEGWDQSTASSCLMCFPDRTAAALVHLPDYDQTFVTGGFDDNGSFDDTWVLDDTQSELGFIPANLTGSPPTARSNFGAVYDQSRDVVVTYGGHTTDMTGVSVTLDELWELGRD